MMNEEAIEEIQIKIAFLERANADLSDVVFRQQQEIRMLGARMKAMSERMEGTQAQENQRSTEDERPPHY